MTHSAWWLVCDAGATFRLVALATKDTITAPFRTWLGKPYALGGAKLEGPRWWLSELSTCPWCIGVWFAAAATALTAVAPDLWQYPAFALTLSAAAGFLSER